MLQKLQIGIDTMLEGLQKKQRLYSCRVRTFRDTLDKSDQDILDEAMASGEFTPHELSIALLEKGVKLSRDSLKRHMRGVCSC